MELGKKTGPNSASRRKQELPPRPVCIDPLDLSLKACLSPSYRGEDPSLATKTLVSQWHLLQRQSREEHSVVLGFLTDSVEKWFWAFCPRSGRRDSSFYGCIWEGSRERRRSKRSFWDCLWGHHSGAPLEMPESMCAGHLTLTWEFMGNDILWNESCV